MLLKILLAAIISISVPCFAETGDDKTKSPAAEKPVATTPPSSATATEESSGSSPAVKSDKKPSMVNYCKKHTC